MIPPPNYPALLGLDRQALDLARSSAFSFWLPHQRLLSRRRQGLCEDLLELRSWVAFRTGWPLFALRTCWSRLTLRARRSRDQFNFG
jgi:hypothetical protein